MSQLHISQININCVKFNDGKRVILYPCDPKDKAVRANLVDDRLSEYKRDQEGCITFVKKLKEEW